MGIPMIEESLHSLDVGSSACRHAGKPAARCTFAMRTAFHVYRLPISPFPKPRTKLSSLGSPPKLRPTIGSMTPFGAMMTGVEIHAQAYETISRGQFLTPASPTAVVAVCLLFTIAAGVIFAFLSGWPAYLLAFALVVGAHSTPHVAFAKDSIFPYLAPVWAAWLSVFAAAAWQYFVVRGNCENPNPIKRDISKLSIL